MPGFETIVRPVVFPNIRPVPTRSLPPQDDPEQGKCTIGGGGGGIIAVTENISTNGSVHNPKETQRKVDTARVYQKKDDGSINRKNFVDIEVAKEIDMTTDFHSDIPDRASEPDGVGNKEALKDSKKSKGKAKEKYKYTPVKETDNIEIKKKDIVKKAKPEDDAQ